VDNAVLTNGKLGHCEVLDKIMEEEEQK